MEQLAVRNGLLLQTTLEILRDATGPLPVREVLREVSERVTLTPYELAKYRDGQERWDVAVRFLTGDATTLGWMSKLGGWTLTEAGVDALERLATAEQLYAELTKRYHEIYQRRRQAQENLGEVQQFMARILGLVGPGSWTAHDDLAELAGSTPREVADFLASGKTSVSGAYRVLNADGSIPPEGMLHATYRGTDLATRLSTEGIEFDAHGRASQEQRLTAEVLKDLLSSETVEVDDGPASARRAWMVRDPMLTGTTWCRTGSGTGSYR